MSFDPHFARDIMLPLVVAAYQVSERPGMDPVLPAGYRKTALVEANPRVMAAMPDVSERARWFVEAVTDARTVFGLIGNNLESTVKTAFVAFRGTRTDSEWLHNFDIATTAYRPVPNLGQVHMGWMALYETIRNSLASNLAAACEGCDQLVAAGHSLVAALAVLAAPDVAENMGTSLELRLTPSVARAQGCMISSSPST